MLIPLLTTPYVARVLGSEGIGRYSYSYSVAYYFVMFAMLGLNNYGNRTIATVREDKTERSKAFFSIYYMQLFTSAVMIVLYIFYVFLFCEDRVLGLIMLLYVCSSALDINWLFFGLEKFKITVVRNTIVKLITVLCVFLFVKTRSDVYIYAGIYAGGMFVSQTILWSRVKKYVHRVPVTIGDVIQHIKPNLILFVPVVAVSLYKYMDKIMLGAMTSKTEVGYYESCERIINIPLGLINSLGVVMLPRISNLMASKQIDTNKKYLSKSIAFVMFLSSSMSFGIMAVSKEFVPLFYGPGFEKCIVIFQVLLPSCLFLAFANVIRTQYLIPKRKDNIYILSVISGALVNIVINALLIPRYQSVGAAAGTVCAEAAVCVIQSVFVRNELPIGKYIKSALLFIFAGMAMYVIIGCFIRLESTVGALFIKIVAGVFVYLVFIIPYVFMNKELKSWVKAALDKNRLFQKFLNRASR